MRKRGGLSIFASVLLFMTAYQPYAESFEYKYREGEKYRILTEVVEDIFVDGVFNNRAEILNKVAVEITDVDDGSGQLFGTFQVSERAWGSGDLYRQTEEIYTSQFWRDSRGRYTIADSYLMPIIRDVPVFPAQELSPGDVWYAEGEEVHDLTVYGRRDPLRIPIDVYYRYIGTQDMNGTKVAAFEIQFMTMISLRGQEGGLALFPAKIMGNTEQIYYWDIEKGRPYSYQDQFSYIYLLSNGRSIEFQGSSSGHVIQEQRLDKEKAAEEIREAIENQGIQDTSVSADSEGITITLENIQFSPDSAYLMPSERAKLNVIAEILKRYPNRDLLIVGHTALAGTEEERQELSERRAAVVGQYLLEKGVRHESQIVYTGKAAHEPIADNSTEEGRRKNRRVEIKILEN